MSKITSIYRTIEIIKLLNSGEKLCVGTLSDKYEVSKRTIRRDFKLIRELFGDFMTKQQDCYQAYKKILLEQVLQGTDLMTLANILNLFGEVSMKNSISKQTKELVKKSISIYDFKTRPIEHFQRKPFMSIIEHAIKFNKEINIEYKISRGTINRIFYPYKILFMNENLYLVGENTIKNKFEFLRISLIVDVKESKKIFFPKQDILHFITEIQTPWAEFNKEKIEIKLRVSKKIRKYFLMKKYLPSQKTIKSFDNGDIEVFFYIHNIKEIEELIIKWLPNITIISPRHLNKTIKRILRKKLEAL